MFQYILFQSLLVPQKKESIKLLETSSGHFKRPGNSLPPPVSRTLFIEMVNTAICLPLRPLQRKIKERLILNHISFIISRLFCCCWAATVNDLSEINQTSEVCKFTVQVQIYLKEVLRFQEISWNMARGFILYNIFFINEVILYN